MELVLIRPYSDYPSSAVGRIAMVSSLETKVDYCKEILEWKWRGVVIGDIVVFVPTVLFFLFLLFRLRTSVKYVQKGWMSRACSVAFVFSRYSFCRRKLQATESLIMSTYYAFLWCVSIYNMVRIMVNYFFPESFLVQ